MTRATVVGLERFVGAKWKGLQCDSCKANYTGVISSANAEVIRRGAQADGWRCDETGDLCKECAND